MRSIQVPILDLLEPMLCPFPYLVGPKSLLLHPRALQPVESPEAPGVSSKAFYLTAFSKNPWEALESWYLKSAWHRPYEYV